MDLSAHAIEESEALRRFRTALDASADMVLLIDVRRRRLIDFNETACRALGYSRAELLHPGALETIRVDQPREALERQFEDLVASEERWDSATATYRR